MRLSQMASSRPVVSMLPPILGRCWLPGVSVTSERIRMQPDLMQNGKRVSGHKADIELFLSSELPSSNDLCVGDVDTGDVSPLSCKGMR